MPITIPFPRSTIPTSSLPDYPPSSSSSSSDSIDTDDTNDTEDYEAEQAALIQEEWEESLRQLEVVLSIIIMPYLGKWYGRRFAYWLYGRYQQTGWTWAFLGLL
ncbi:hypothetical protein M231_06419 [Tremella mesenterica]|uniref:Uncharacterized protein n=1 Tax=Tremella mesenterica TaxID=5217 RepID=A0A4Q1BGC1_TREME|nr:uncharacterized protein TREMEDRAFT_56350 [Tremella mesenterica DSM 1558]EIW71200.1 hypothetical protein TREMEDRAFT_56350 [Tremella mesenterica DSM 1558]RXK36283.1 hypothetical protein M231_06419 [Tremella mesenterica]